MMDSIETANISAVVRGIVKQMNFLKPDKDPEDYVKNVGEFLHEPCVGEVFATWYARNQDVYETEMVG
ncbi:unnamed protein product [Hymenolepis diminuta]|uniref:SCP2 domain-containing protein n=1 Tax=Hymenolepis diminuta TaxID=6216 RepID=A0A0R3SMD9_HYMDI|nr:unnamed protein product [Hymenolepis diminuta]